MIEIDQLTVRFGRFTAVDRCSLRIEPGESVALWGRNGAGKSTIIRAVLGLLRFRGSVRVNGLDILREGRRARRLIGYVPQELPFSDEYRVHEAVAFFAALRGARPGSVDAVLGPVGLCGQGGKRVRELSGGMKQRLALALALLGDPPVLVLDEMTASLDAGGRGDLIRLLRSLHRTDRCMVFASHRAEEIAALATRIVSLEAGRITGEAPAAEFAPGPATGASLHLHIPDSARAQAMESLRIGGFDPRLNGVGVIVPVREGRKAAPFEALTRAGVPVTDFDLSDGREGRHP